jgi:8-oxo-dGTP pyrophosphatase MutT (NUDIX family)
MHDIIEIFQSKLRPLDENDFGFAASDYDLNPDASLPSKSPRKSAILIPLIKRDTGCKIIFTRRSFQLRAHSGQIAFPGGRYDDDDENLVQTAIREAHEEIGVEKNAINPIGKGDNYLSGSNFLITPVIAQIDESAKFKPNHQEVDEIFEVPLEYIFNPLNQEIREYIFEGKPRKFYCINYRKYFIWGVTAGIIANLTKRIALEMQNDN